MKEEAGAKVLIHKVFGKAEFSLSEFLQYVSTNKVWESALWLCGYGHGLFTCDWTAEMAWNVS